MNIYITLVLVLLFVVWPKNANAEQYSIYCSYCTPSYCSCYLGIYIGVYYFSDALWKFSIYISIKTRFKRYCLVHWPTLYSWCSWFCYFLSCTLLCRSASKNTWKTMCLLSAIFVYKLIKLAMLWFKYKWPLAPRYHILKQRTVV